MNHYTKLQLLQELLHGTSIDDLQKLVDFKKKMHSISNPAPKKPIPTPRKSVKQMAMQYEENILLPPHKFRDKPVPLPRTKKQ